MYLAMETELSQSPTPVCQARTEYFDTPLSAERNNLYLQTLSCRDIKQVEAEILPLLIRLFRRYNGRYSASDILNRVHKNQQQIWLAREIQDDRIVMLCLTEIVHYPQLKTVCITDVVGKGHERWLWIEKEIEQWAKSIGCKKIETEARIGWLKWKPEGYKIEKIHLTKDI